MKGMKQKEKSLSKSSLWSIECMQFDLENDLAWNWKRKRKYSHCTNVSKYLQLVKTLLCEEMHCVSNSKTKNKNHMPSFATHAFTRSR